MILSSLVLAISSMLAAEPSPPLPATHQWSSLSELPVAEQHAMDSAIQVRRLYLRTRELSHLEFEYQSVCPECFRRSLACGKVDLRDTSFACLPESQDSLGSDLNTEEH